MQFSMKFAVLAFLAQVVVISASPIADDGQFDDSLVARAPTKRSVQEDCEDFCTAVFPFRSPAWQRCVQDCVGAHYPSPPPTPPRPRPRPLPQQKKPKTGVMKKMKSK